MNHHPLMTWKNTFNGGLGMFIVSASSFIAECCATTSLQWAAVDLEASPATRQDLLHIAQAFNGSSVTLLVRVAQNNQQQIEAALDTGVQGVIVPKISDSVAALAAVEACYYPPLGRRGLNPIRCSAYLSCVDDYIKQSNALSCFVQIETKEAIENLEEIAFVKGISGLFIGSGDLALDYEIPGQFEHEIMNTAIEKVLKICQQHHLISGIFAYSEILAKKYRDMGFQMIGIGNEIKFLRHRIEESIEAISTDK